MTTTDSDPKFAQIAATFGSLDDNDNYRLAYGKCTSPEQQHQLIQLRDAARDAYFKAIADGLDADTPMVRELTAQLTVTNNQITTMLKNLTDIVAFLKLTSDAIKLAASVVALAAAA